MSKNKWQRIEGFKKSRLANKLNPKHFNALAAEIREALIETVSKTGGHLASNLGAVELTIALNFCFNFPKDKIVWDVGHQSYVHKMLTGRLPAFSTLRQAGGLSGFPKCAESEYDFFDTGHSSTSISAALGFAKARDLRGGDENVIAFIGDGSITGGLAFEALNNAGRLKSQFLVVLNDNDMSISKNVGALSTYFSKIRTAPTYIGAKRNVWNFLERVPAVGPVVARAIEKSKDSLRHLLLNGSLFEALGFIYAGPIDGHNINDLIEVFNHVKGLQSPVLIHVVTKKGKGYAPAEDRPDDFHGVEPFDVATGKRLIPAKKSYSDVFGAEMLELASKNDKILAVSAAMVSATGLSAFQKKYPSRTFDVGIAEAHAVTFAAGLAKSGYIPVVAVYSTFLQRAYDQILHDVCLQKLPVIFAVDRAGIVGRDGETHQGVFDLSYLSHIPNLTVMAPKDANELRCMLSFAAELHKPVAIRYPREEAEVFSDKRYDIIYKQAELIYNSGKARIVLVSVGAMYQTAEKVYTALSAGGVECSLYNARFIKPVPDNLISGLTGAELVCVLEDNAAAGGFADSLAREAAVRGYSLRIKAFAFPDEFIAQGSRSEIFEKYGLNAEGITAEIMRLLK